MAAAMQWHLQAKDSLELIWNIEIYWIIIIESGSGKSRRGLWAIWIESSGYN